MSETSLGYATRVAGPARGDRRSRLEPCARACCAPRARRAFPPAPRADAERRPIAVMFCDLAGSTGFAARLGAEDWRNLVGSYLDEASLAVTGRRAGRARCCRGRRMVGNLGGGHLCRGRRQPDAARVTVLVRPMAGLPVADEQPDFAVAGGDNQLRGIERAGVARGLPDAYMRPPPREGPARNSPSEREPICMALFASSCGLGDQLVASSRSVPASGTSGVYGLFDGAVDGHTCVLCPDAIEQSSPVGDRLIATA